MTSQRKREANARNAKRSTGPRTFAGKLRSSKNALRHGLATTLSGSTELTEQALGLATAIAQGHKRQRFIVPYARIIAYAHVELCRAREARQHVLEEALQMARRGRQRQLSDVSEIINQLTRLDRYERRALSKRKSAIRALVQAALCELPE